MRGIFIAVVLSTILVGCVSPSTRVQTVKQDAFVPLDPAGKNIKVKHFDSGAGLLEEVSRLGGAQGEFEKNEDFIKRMSNLGNFSVYSLVSPSQIKFDKETGALTFKATMHDALGAGYDPEKPKYEAMKFIYPSVMLGEDVRVTGQYQGQNSFGASALIEKRKIDRFYVVFNPVAKQLGHILNFSFVGSLNVPPAELEKERKDIGMLLTLAPAPNYFKTAKHFGTPTIANPYESEVTNFFFPAKVYWVRLVNVKTGKIYDDEVKMKVEVW